MGCNGSNEAAAAPRTGSSGNGKNEAAAAPPSSGRDTDKKEAKAENRSYKDKMQFLEQVPLFKCLPKDQHPNLAAACVLTEFEKGRTVIKQNDPEPEFFLIKTGEVVVNVSKGGAAATQVAKLKAGDYFGDDGREGAMAATIIAESELVTFKITRNKFRELGLDKNLQSIADALRKNENLQTMVVMDESRVKQIVDVAC